MNDWLYIPSWKRGQRPANETVLELSQRNLSWLLFLDECGVGKRLVSLLLRNGQKVTTVRFGGRFHKDGQGNYIIDSRQEESYHFLMQQLRSMKEAPDIIVHLGCLTNPSDQYPWEDSYNLVLERGFNSLLYLSQAIDGHFPGRPIQIKVISNCLQDVTGEEQILAEKAILIGPCRVIPQEYPNLACSCIDIVLSKSNGQEHEELCVRLVQELLSKSKDPLVAYRGKHRWVQIIEPLQLEKPENGPRKLRNNGVYVITGGLGGVGLVLAEYLAQNVQAKLVLVGRSEMPDKAQWEDWLRNHDEFDRTSRRIRKLRAIEELGAEVQVKIADVTDFDQMENAISQTLDQFGQIHGVIHAAGIAGGGVIQLKSPEIAEKVLAPKVRGTLILEKLLKKINLDFFFLCSSISSLVAEPGQGDYCAASAFLDAYAQKGNPESKVISINWCAWQEVGMAVNTDVPPDLKDEKERRLRHGILPQEGKEIFARVLDIPLPQIIVSKEPLAALEQRGIEAFAMDLPSEKREGKGEKSAHARPDLSSVYVVPGNSTEKTLAEIWQDVLKIDKVGIHDNFFELGGHSLLASRLLARLRNAFQAEITMGNMFERPTVHSLSKMILEGEKKDPSFLDSKMRGQKRKERKIKKLRPKKGRRFREQFQNV